MYNFRDKDVIVAGNGPSLRKTVNFSHNRNVKIVRVNNFFFETQFYLGKTVDLLVVGGDRWLFPFYLQTAKKLIKKDDYKILNWTCFETTILNKYEIKDATKLYIEDRAHALEHVKFLQKKYGNRKPTTGVLAVLYAYLLGAKTINVIGLDNYSLGQPYEYDNSQVDKQLRQKNKKEFPKRFHALELDLEIMDFISAQENVEVVNFSQSEVFDVSKLNGSSNSKNLKCTTKLNYHLPKFAPLSYFVPVAVVPLLKKFYSIYKMLKLG